jgi:hypothetical protein
MEISLGQCPADITTSQRVQRHKEVHSSCHNRRPSDRLFGSPRNKFNCDYATIIQVQLFLRQETLGFISCSLDLVDFNEGLTLEFYFRPIANFSYVYATCGLLLFAIIGWTVTLGFRSLHQELFSNCLLTTFNNNGCPETVSLAEKGELIEMLANWKRLHVLLIDTVDGINDCLGPVLLIWVAHIFVGFIATPFYILDGIHFNTGSLSSSWILLIMNFCLFGQHLFHLLIITGISSRIWHEVSH